MNVFRIEEPSRPARGGFALWALGFRPFYLGGALFGAAALLAWMAAWSGHPLPGIRSYLPGMFWHAHEMIFGFGAAIVAGFLLTAVRAWTSVTPAQGKSLAALWLLWLAGRVAVAYAPPAIAAVVDSLFLPACALVLLRVLVHAKNSHNIFLPVALGMLAALNVAFQVSMLALRADWALHSAWLAVGMLVLFITIIGGRIIPSFTANAVPGHTARRWKAVERLVMPLSLFAFVFDAAFGSGVLVAVVAGAAACVQGARIWGWRSWRVGNRPIVAILHVAYAWILVGFALLALSALGFVAHTIAIHAFTVGAIGCAIMAMITRTARGHTGRKLVAGYVDVACYALLVLAALIRVLGPWVAPQWLAFWIEASAACWVVAFAAYCCRYASWLIAARVDGKEG
ncbi:NnrS family protein [Paraburkholderia mimosarum]|uniref:NnrS family protein n=1 Tax=Paraburkholderia mimosarum TaxID=312026 RepID=UPI0003F95508|nr:NnrS family protein [Paraburkholderia mimosarum]